MAFKIADRVLETSTTTGTGTLTLAGAVTGYQTFATIGNANTCFYCIEGVDGSGVPTGEWEVGIGTYTSSGTTLARTSVIYSSNSNAAVNLSAGTKRVFVTSVSDYGNPLVMGTTANRAIQVADQTALSGTSGYSRGKGSVDLQIKRSLATQVASGTYAFVGGGQNNKATGTTSVVVGGYANTAGGNARNVVCGGKSNTASAAYSFIGSGRYHTASGDRSGVIAGDTNVASAKGSLCGGGFYNTASGNYSHVPGGKEALANKFGQLAHASGKFSAVGDAQGSVFKARISTTNATPTEMFLDGSSARMTLANDTTWAFYILVVARRTDADNESATYEFRGCIDRNTNAASTALVGAVTKTVIAEDTAAWECDVTADTTNGALIITVTGEAAKTIQWVARVETVETTG